MSTKIEVEAVFGSASRGNTDKLSDRDILIVDRDVDRLRRRQAELEWEGWSVASYTWPKLHALISRGALFVQHLKDESSIIQDQNLAFSKALSEFKPKLCYKDELYQNAQLANLAAIHPSTADGLLWAADVLYVTIRNFGVLHLAQKEKYMFAFPDIVDTLADSQIIDGNATSAVKDLRLLKNFYRSGTSASQTHVSELLKTVLNALPVGAFPRTSQSLEPLRFLRNCKSLPGSRPAYQHLRNLERCNIAARALSCSRHHSSSLSRLTTWIQNPRVYANLAARLEQGVLERLQSMARELPREVELLSA